MGPRTSKPNFQGVIDIGLRDVGVRNQPRKHVAQAGKAMMQGLGLIVLSGFVMCAVLAATGVGPWIVVPFALASTLGLLLVAVRSAKRSPTTVVKVTADGKNQATWILLAPFVLASVAAIAVQHPLVIPMIAVAAIGAVLLLRTRGYVPDALRELRALIAPGETVLGDAMGRVPKVRRWHDAFRLIVATDRRLLVTGSARSEPFALIDVPYARVNRFGFEWKLMGRMGQLSLTVDGTEHVFTQVTPANLVSVAAALESHAVPTDDPPALAAAKQAWDETRREADSQQRERAPRRPLLERMEMATPQFDHGLWILLGLAALTLYLNPFGIGLGMSRDPNPAMLVIPFAAGIAGYVSGTRSSLAYLIPLNLLVGPALFFVDAVLVLVLMVVLSAGAAAGLAIGSSIRRPAAPTSAGPAPERGSLRYTLGGRGLIRLTGMMLGVLAAALVVTAALGFELSALSYAIDEQRYKQTPVDGKSNLTGGAASSTYTRGPDLRELITDQRLGAGPTDGARWELRSSFKKGRNVVSLASYVFEPRLDDPKAIADFVADKDREHERLAGGVDVNHTQRVVDGRKGYVWDHENPLGYWFYAAWFPQAGETVRVECIARKQKKRFKRLCAEAVDSLRFRR